MRASSARRWTRSCAPCSDADGPWEADESIASMRSAIVDYLDRPPREHSVRCMNSISKDLYARRKTPTSDAEAALRGVFRSVKDPSTKSVRSSPAGTTAPTLRVDPDGRPDPANGNRPTSHPCH
jgi:hypothetical protein